MYIRKILLSSILGASLFGILAGCAPIVPAPTIERIIVPLDKDSPRVYRYQVKSGDTLYAISQLHGISVAQIAEMNDLAAPYVIYPGDTLVVDRSLISVALKTSVDTSANRPNDQIAAVATSETSSSSANSSKRPSSGIRVTKLPRPPTREMETPSTTSQIALTSQETNVSEQQTSRNSSNAEASPDSGKRQVEPPTKALSSESAVAQTTPEQQREETTESVKTPPSNQSSNATASSNPTEQNETVSSSSESEDAETSSFVARTEPSDAPTESSVKVDINSLPKGWTWPVSANPTNTFGKDDGLNYFLNQGNQVVAAASGRVTYAGVALGDFKYMVLIKTPDDYVIQYDFNSDLTVQENDLISKGQDLIKIANNSKGQQSASSDEYRKVFFAIRKKGVPQNPNKLIGKPKTGET
ncbi:MAG: LysM peptidoglycan-binding domain-containing protein [Gammaproteobacteria bacterium]|nr:LysM peptidoglycan-binding domain-containing protein [Gammaproteobacteria bacterium]MYF38936.1 LysM peptidoglycan-binding domain-containing protein [Gammaproteobacteria bacterium]